MAVKLPAPYIKPLICGTATIPAGQTSVIVHHNIGEPPIVLVTPTTNLNGKNFWVSDITNTSFTINISSTATEEHRFYWCALIP